MGTHKMQQMRNVFSLLALCIFHPGVLRGDLMPISYEGYTLSAKQENDISMQSEEVLIYCESRCRVCATFEMINGGAKPVDLFVGFPIENVGRKKQRIYDFKVRVNGSQHRTKVKRLSREPQEIVGATWFGWDQSFPPGRTLIRVEYHVEPSYSYAEPWENVYYVLETGKYWRDQIGTARIAIHFEEPLASEQVRGETTPAGFQVEGNTVCWRFTDFEPTRMHNIRLEYMPSVIYRELQCLRRNIEENPGDEACVVELARHYFALGPYGGLAGGFLPQELSPEQFRAAMAKIADPDDKAVLQDVYRETRTRVVQPEARDEAGRVVGAKADEEIVYTFEGSQERSRIVHILNAADYTPYELSEYVVQARDMLEHLLEKNPRNADAWMVYLSNCFRFRLGACPGQPNRDWCPVSPWQKQMVQRASRHCPSHEGLKLWHDFVMSNAADSQVPRTLWQEWYWNGPGKARDPLTRLWKHCMETGVYEVQWEP